MPKSQREIVINLTVIKARMAAKQLRDVANAEKAAARGAKKLANETKKAGKNIGFMRIQTSGLRRTLGAIRNQLLVVAFAFGGIIRLFKGWVAAAIEQETAVRKLETVLKSTGYVAGLTAKQLQEMAAGLQQVTMIGDETIISAQSLLLTYTQIGRDIFPQALEAIMNVSTAMGTDLQSSVLQLGKALNDPVLGITALTRVGIQFSVEQKKQIKLFVEQGNVAEAQKLILHELETEFGGLARAMTDTTEGALKQMTNAWGDMKEALGEGLTPAIKSLSIAMKGMFEDLNMWVKAYFGHLTKVEVVQREIARLTEETEDRPWLEKLLGTPAFVEEMTTKLAKLKIELVGLLAEEAEKAAAEAAEIRLKALERWAFAVEEVEEAYVRMLETVKPLLGDLDDSIQVLDPTQQLIIDNVKSLTDGLIQATLYGQKFGDAIVSSLKAIAAQLIEQAAVYLLMNLFTGGTASIGGFFKFAGTGNFRPSTPKITTSTPTTPAITTQIYAPITIIGDPSDASLLILQDGLDRIIANA